MSDSTGPDWVGSIEDLAGAGFLESLSAAPNLVLRLRTPFWVRFAPESVEALLDSWTQKERGGILACRPAIEGDMRVLQVNLVHFVRNTSRSPYTSYIPDAAERECALRRVLIADKSVPIEFHSHPVPRRRNGFDLSERLQQLLTSAADQSCAEVQVRLGRYAVHVAQAVLVKDLPYAPGLFVGIYGGLISPANFEDSVKKAGYDAMADMAKLIKGNSPAGSFLDAVSELAPPLLALLVRDMPKAMATLALNSSQPRQYWGIMTEGARPDIEIPLQTTASGGDRELDVVQL